MDEALLVECSSSQARVGEVRSSISVVLTHLALAEDATASSAGMSDFCGVDGGLVEAQLLEHRRGLAALQELLSWHADRWDKTWKEEAEFRAEGDQEVESRLCGRLDTRINAVDVKVEQASSCVWAGSIWRKSAKGRL